MNKTSYDKVGKAALFLRSQEAQAARPYLDEGLQLAMDLIDCLAWGDLDWCISADLAMRCKSHKKREINRQTVVQVLRSLKENGFPLESSASKGFRLTEYPWLDKPLAELAQHHTASYAKEKGRKN